MSVSGYTELRELGAGAGGRVVAARHDATGVPVAVKYLADDLRGDPEFVRAYRIEARVMTELDDQHIARLYEYVEDATTTAIVMELVDGPALSAVLADGGALTPEAALFVLYGSLSALATAHERGVVHRDYKPGNVIVARDGDSKLVDFGIAARSGADGLTSGSPSYMAPEQWRGEAAGPPSDIYAATATFVECLTGAPPFVAADLEALARQHRNAPVPADTVPEPVRGLVRAGLAKDPARRPQSARAFLAALTDAALAGYGEDWAERGRGHLATRAAALLALLPLGAAEVTGIDLARTRLGRVAVLGGAAILAMAVGGGAAALTPVAHHRTFVPAAGPARPTPDPTGLVPTGAASTSTSVPVLPPPISTSRAVPTTPTPTSMPVLPPPISTSRVLPPPIPPHTLPHVTPTPLSATVSNLAFNWAKKPPIAVASFTITATTTASVHVTIEYTDGAAFDRTVHLTLSGARTYDRTDSEDFTGVCGIITVIVKTDVGGDASRPMPYSQC